MRFSYDAFVLNNKKDALYYSGPFSLSDKSITIKVGEVYKVYSIGNTGTISVTNASVASKVSTSVSGNELTITGTAATAANTPTVLTITDAGSSTTSTVTVTVVA